MSLKNVHIKLPLPESFNKVSLVKSDYVYYHYGMDGVSDQGWGCGYRTLQTIASWFILNNKTCSTQKVPSVFDIQSALVELGDKEKKFVGSKDWIGSFEVFLVLEKLFQVSSKIKHVNSGSELLTLTDEIFKHFNDNGSPIMMGGDKDNSSKGIIGIAINETKQDVYFLVLDPHYTKDQIDDYTVEELQDQKFVEWRSLSNFDVNSFYNLCIPQT